MTDPRRCPKCEKNTLTYARAMARWVCSDARCGWRDR